MHDHERSDWLARDLRVNWHPYTQMTTLDETPPLLIERAEGIRLFDADGRVFYDTVSSWWCNVHGHGHPHLRAALQRQAAALDHVLFAGVTHRPAIELAERLVAVTPAGLERVFYSDNGSTAVEVALKMALQYWRNMERPEKRRFVSLDRGYHGDTVGCMSVSSVDRYRSPFEPMLFASDQVPTPHCFRCPLQHTPDSCGCACVHFLEEHLAQHAGETAALILEPLLLGAGGMIIYPVAYLRQAAALAKQYDVLLILDEVATGFGRTGTLFACEQAGVSPDFLCLSKGLTGGMFPFAATLTTAAVYDAFLGPADSPRTLYHGHTYTANPLGCAVALAGLELFADGTLLANVAARAAQLRTGVQPLAALPHVGEVRTLGMVAALELDDTVLPRAIYRRGLQEGLLLRPIGNVTYLFLPPCTTEAELTDILTRARTTLEAVLAE